MVVSSIVVCTEPRIYCSAKELAEDEGNEQTSRKIHSFDLDFPPLLCFRLGISS